MEELIIRTEDEFVEVNVLDSGLILLHVDPTNFVYSSASANLTKKQARELGTWLIKQSENE